MKRSFVFNLTSNQVKELCEGDSTDSEADDPLNKLPASAVKMAKVTQTIQVTTPQDLARALLRQEGDAAIARGRLQAMRKLLSDTEHYLERD